MPQYIKFISEFFPVHRTANSPDAAMDQDRVPVLLAGVHVHETSEKDAAEVDDGDARNEWSATSASHVAVGPTRASSPGLCDTVQTQDGGNGAGRPAPSQL